MRRGSEKQSREMVYTVCAEVVEDSLTLSSAALQTVDVFEGDGNEMLEDHRIMKVKNQKHGDREEHQIDQENIPGDNDAAVKDNAVADEDFVVTLNEADQQALVRNLLDSAAGYLAISTENPKLPEGHKLPLHRQIAMLRALRGWKQDRLAVEAGVTQTDVSRAESNDPRAKEAAVKQICALLKIPV